MRQRFCRVCGDWHDLDKPLPHNCAPEPSWGQSDTIPVPHFIRDTMEPVQCQATGKIHDSKSNLRKGYKQAGVVEVGNDPARFRQPPKPKIDRAELRQIIEKAKARVDRGERTRDELKFK